MLGYLSYQQNIIRACADNNGCTYMYVYALLINGRPTHYKHICRHTCKQAGCRYLFSLNNYIFIAYGEDVLPLQIELQISSQIGSTFTFESQNRYQRATGTGNWLESQIAHLDKKSSLICESFTYFGNLLINLIGSAIVALGICTHSILYIYLCVFFVYRRSGYTVVIVLWILQIRVTVNDRVEKRNFYMRNEIFNNS